MHVNVKDITNAVFGKLTVVRPLGKDKQGRVFWEVQCACGSERRPVRGDNLRNRHTTSCGCDADRSRCSHRGRTVAVKPKRAALKTGKFYTYTWLQYDGRAYYVGKGHGNRAIRKGSPRDLDRIIIQEHESEADAFEAEKFLIAYYGRKDQGTGILRNMTDGGEGTSNPSAATRQKLRDISTVHGHASRQLTGRSSPELQAYYRLRDQFTNPKNLRFKHWESSGVRFRFGSFLDFLKELGNKPEPKALYNVVRIDPSKDFERSNVIWALVRSRASRGRMPLLKPAEVIEIRRRVATEKGVTLAREFGVSDSVISGIKFGKGTYAKENQCQLQQ